MFLPALPGFCARPHGNQDASNHRSQGNPDTFGDFVSYLETSPGRRTQTASSDPVKGVLGQSYEIRPTDQVTGLTHAPTRQP